MTEFSCRPSTVNQEIKSIKSNELRIKSFENSLHEIVSPSGTNSYCRNFPEHALASSTSHAFFTYHFSLEFCSCISIQPNISEVFSLKIDTKHKPSLNCIPIQFPNSSPKNVRTICLINLFGCVCICCGSASVRTFVWATVPYKFRAYEKCLYLIFELCIYPGQIINHTYTVLWLAPLFTEMKLQRNA